MFVGISVRRALERSAGAVRQLEDRAPTIQTLVPCRRLGTRVRRSNRRSRQPVSDDRQHLRSRGFHQTDRSTRLNHWDLVGETIAPAALADVSVLAAENIVSSLGLLGR
jgi:hypothetical protein